MARPFSATDAKRIIERHQNIIEKLNNAVSSVEKYRTKAKEASDALVAQEVLKVLADIPIEEINRDIAQIVLEQENMNRTKTVEHLQISRTTLWRMLQK